MDHEAIEDVCVGHFLSENNKQQCGVAARRCSGAALQSEFALARSAAVLRVTFWQCCAALLGAAEQIRSPKREVTIAFLIAHFCKTMQPSELHGVVAVEAKRLEKVATPGTSARCNCIRASWRDGEKRNGHEFWQSVIL